MAQHFLKESQGLETHHDTSSSAGNLGPADAKKATQKWDGSQPTASSLH